MRKVQVAPILVLLLLDVYTATSKSLLSKRGAVEDVQDDNGLKDLAKQLVKNRGSGYIDCDNILVWDALLQEEENQERTIKTCDLCSDDEFLKMHMELFEKHCGYGKGGFPPICFNPAGWENLLYSFQEEQLVKACALCDNGMFRRVHPEIFGEHCELDEEEEDGEDEKEDTRGTAEEEEGEDEKEETRGTAEEEDEEDEKEETRGTAEEEDGDDEKEDTRGTAEEDEEDDEKEETRGTAEEDGEEDEKEETRGTAEEEDEDDEKEETRGTAEEEDGEDEKEETRGTAEEEDEDDEKEETRGTAEEEEDGEDEKEDTRGTAEEEDEDDEKEDTRGTAEEEDEEDEKEETRGTAEEEDEDDEKEESRGTAEEEEGEDEKESREVEPNHDEETRGNKLNFIDKGKTDDDLVLAVQQFVRDTAKNMEDLADRLVRYDRKQKVKEWEP